MSGSKRPPGDGRLGLWTKGQNRQIGVRRGYTEVQREQTNNDKSDQNDDEGGVADSRARPDQLAKSLSAGSTRARVFPHFLICA
jgi:hypothetical protein